jgi:phosphate:Na+ symporter
MAFVTALGGLGLFLLAMIWLTSGLRELSGNTFRRFLLQFTRTPISGVMTGAVSTALLQSSSATTVMAVGFVGANLMTFPQALGVIFGANLGTTLTGWIVATFGFKLSLGELVLPIFFISAVMRLFGNASIQALGQALAGFALLFLGIEFLKDGMSGLQGVITPAQFPDDGLFGRLQLVGLGIVLTLVTQSSSAGVAIAMTALVGEAINLQQAAAMVIGMDIGTTVTAAMATLNASTAARRTGWSHVIYNVCTGMMAFVLLDAFLTASAVWIADPAITLAAFHTAFNFLGVLLIIPFAKPFSGLVMRLVPARASAITRSLTEIASESPVDAFRAVRATVERLTSAELGYLIDRLDREHPSRDDERKLQQIATALPELRLFLEHTDSDSDDARTAEAIAHALHLTDHLGRLYLRLTEQERVSCLYRDSALNTLASDFRAVLRAWYESGSVSPDIEQQLQTAQVTIATYSHEYRDTIIQHAATGSLDDEEARYRLDASRWLLRVSDHLLRIHLHHKAIDRLEMRVE